MLPRFSTEYARECDELTGQAGSVPSKHYRNQVVVRAFGSPPSDFTLNKLYTYSLDDENDYNFKWRFRDLVLRPTDDYNLLEFCKAANVPVSFYGLDEAAIVRPQRPGLPMFQEHKREWDVRDYFAYKHCLDLSIQQEDAKTANAEVKKFSSLAKRLQWDNDYEDYYEFGSGGAWACGRTTGHQRTPTNRDSKANSTKQLQPKPQSSPLTTPKKSPTGKGKARSYTITLDDTDEEDGSSTDEDFFDFKDTNVYKRIKHTSSNNMSSSSSAASSSFSSCSSGSGSSRSSSSSSSSSSGGGSGDSSNGSAPNWRDLGISKDEHRRLLALAREYENNSPCASAIATEHTKPAPSAHPLPVPTPQASDREAMLNALMYTKNPESTRPQKASSLMIAAVAIASNKESAAATDMKGMLEDHHRAKAEAAAEKAQGKSATSARAARAHEAITAICSRRAASKRNRTTKAKQTTAQKTQISHQDLVGKQGYDSDSDLPFKIEAVVKRSSDGTVNANGRSMFASVSNMTASGH